MAAALSFPTLLPTTDDTEFTLLAKMVIVAGGEATNQDNEWDLLAKLIILAT